MFQVQWTAEDNIVIATEARKPLVEQPSSPSVDFDVLIIDQHSGKTHKTTMSFAELTAVFALGVGSVGEDKTEGYWPEKLYAAVQKCLENCPRECSPVP